MATSGGAPPWPKSLSLPGDSSSSRRAAKPMLLRSEKKGWSSFPMGKTAKGTFKASSNLLEQLVLPYQVLDANREEHQDEGENAKESSESSESEMLNLEEEFDGVLREEVVAEALHQLGRSGSGTEQVYLNLTLSGCNLIDMSILCDYVHLQKLDVSVNKIEDLSCVSCMPYLLELNASQNKLSTFFDFKPPKNLKKVDFSYNQISKMCDLSAYQALTKLILDNNEIEEISGLELCGSLTHLSLAQNKLTAISGLGMLPIKILCLSHNRIEKITGLDNLKVLQILDLSHNQISSLQGLEDHNFLEVVNLEDNKIAELGEIEYIENLPLLRVLNLLRNPIHDKSEYWFFIIFMLLRLTELDQKKIKVQDKVAAVNKYSPPPEVVAAQDHLTHVVNSVMQPQRIFDSTLPSLDTPYPMLVLTGPEACGKRELAHRLCRHLSTYFKYGACHTTRPPYFGEGDRVDYHFISQEVFNEMVNLGKFILTFNYGNHSYGLSRDTIEDIARDGFASCVHMEIEGVRSLKHTYFEPRYLLVLPVNKKKYEGYLRRKGLFSRVEIEFAVSRVDHYIKINQNFPGYFDAVINADDLDVAYQQMSQLVKEYLGLCEESATRLAPTAGNPSNKKTPCGVPAHLLPSPRRMAKLQADGQITGPLSGMQACAQIPENQSLAPSQDWAPPQPERPPSPHASVEPSLQPRSPAPSISQGAQDSPPNQKEKGVQQSDISSKIITTDLPENEARTSEMAAGEVGETPAAPSQGPPPHSDPPCVQSPQPDQGEESGEIKVTPATPPPSEPLWGPGPISLSPQRTQSEETESAGLPPSSSHHDPPREPSTPDGTEMPRPSLGDTQQPLEEGTPKAEVGRVGTPHPGLPHPQDPADSSQTQDREAPVTWLSRSQVAPTRLPQPRVLAPLQSRRPTPGLLSPSREEALGTASAQTMTPSPRPPPAQEGDPSKLPLISPPHSQPPQHLSPRAAHSPRQAQGETGREVKLPLVSPPTQQQAPGLPQEAEAQAVRLPHLHTPRNVGARRESRPPGERQVSKAGRSSSKKVPDVQTSPLNQELVQQTGARKKQLPLRRETGRGPAPLGKLPRGSHWTASQPDSHRRLTHPQEAAHPDPSRLRILSGNQSSKVPSPETPEPPRADPLPRDTQLQEGERGKVPSSRKQVMRASLPPKDLVHKVAVSRKGPSLRGSGGPSKEREAPLSRDLPTQEAHLPPRRSPQNEKASAGSTPDGSAPTGCPAGKELHPRGRSPKRERASDPSEWEGTAPTLQPAGETRQHRESSVQDITIPQLKFQESSQKSTALSSFDFLDSTDRNYLVKVWARLSAQKTPVERNSIERQYETARQALMGRTAPHHTLLFQRGSVPVPISNTPYFIALEQQKTSEICEDSFKKSFGTYPEKSNTVSLATTKYSALVQSCPWLKDLSFEAPECSVYSRAGSEISDNKEGQALKALDKSSLQSENGLHQPRQHTVAAISRPGSNTKPTLPPIPQGRKYTMLDI